MKKLSLSHVALPCLILALLAGCKKNIHQPDSDCRIEKVTSVAPYSGWADITYNQLGDPVSIASSEGTLSFKYDKFNRLSEFGNDYGNGWYLYWHHYYYNNRNLIVADSMYDSGHIQNGQPVSHNYLHYITYQYDAWSRVIRTRDSADNGTPPWNPIVVDYKYDNNGNLINGAAYDNHRSFRSTNKIWMFIDLNYSVNNETPTGPYNIADLPLTAGMFSYEQLFGFLHTGPINIVYSCKACEVAGKSGSGLDN